MKLKYPNQLIHDAIFKSLNSDLIKTEKPKENSKIIYISSHSDLTPKYTNHIKFILNASPYKNKFTPLTIAYKTNPNLLCLLKYKQIYQVKPCSINKCKCCEILIPYKNSIKINNKEIFINGNFSCISKNCIYILFCKSCDSSYIGKTTLPLNKRINLHRNQIINTKYTILPISKHIQTCSNNQFQTTILYSHPTEISDIILSKIENHFIELINPTFNKKC